MTTGKCGEPHASPGKEPLTLAAIFLVVTFIGLGVRKAQVQIPIQTVTSLVNSGKLLKHSETLRYTGKLTIQIMIYMYK